VPFGILVQKYFEKLQVFYLSVIGGKSMEDAINRVMATQICEFDNIRLW
jgi:hypothetical protein